MNGDRGQAKTGSQSLRPGSFQLVSLEKEIVEATGGALTATCSPHFENFVVAKPPPIRQASPNSAPF